MRVLVVNAGSSSVKLVVLDGAEIMKRDSVDPGEAEEALGAMLGERVDAVGHRVVHGGTRFTRPTLVDDEVLAGIEDLAALAPLHQGPAVGALRQARAALPGVPQVACFDTAFHRTMPAASYTYAVPERWRAEFGVRRYGFHGLSHAYASRRAAELLGRRFEDLRIVTCHLGAGASLAAVAGGRSVDTTMGFTPLEGLVMNTRSGTVDPGLVLWLLTEAGLDAAEITTALESSSGLAGLSSTSGDLRDVMAAVARGDERAVLAFEVYVHRLAREAGGMAAALGGLDSLVFTGGVGEHQPALRAAAAERLAFLGVGVDGALNQSVTGDGEITGSGATVRTWVVTAREDLEMARQVREVLGEGA